MLLFLGFLLGIVFTNLVFNGKININIHHTYKQDNPPISKEELAEAYKTMQEPDTELDKLYEAMGDVKEIMEGSDRIDG